MLASFRMGDGPRKNALNLWNNQVKEQLAVARRDPLLNVEESNNNLTDEDLNVEEVNTTGLLDGLNGIPVNLIELSNLLEFLTW